MTKCKQEGCTSHTEKEGYCLPHIRDKYPELYAASLEKHREYLKNRRCKIETCTNRGQWKGYCQKHCKEFAPEVYRHYIERVNLADECSVDGCHRMRQRKGYCMTHLKERFPEVVEKRHKDHNKWKKTKYHLDPEWREKHLNEKSIYWRKIRSVAKLQVIKHYTNGVIKCMCAGCNISNIEFLTVDHVNGRNGEKKRGLGLYRWIIKNDFPDGIQIFCFNCNIAKGSREYCPVHHSKS